MEQTPHSPRRMLLIGLGSAVALIAIMGLVAFVLFGLTKHDNPTDTTADQSSTKTPSSSDVKQNVDNLSENLKQSESDLNAAKEALKDGDKQIKLGS